MKRSPGSLLNGVLFVVNASELAGFDRREWVYDREEISGQLRGVTLAGGAAWIYVGKPRHLMSGVDSWRTAAVRASYLGILETGIAVGMVATACELLPLRIDDNLTIPIFVGFTTWGIATLLAIPLH